MLKYLNIWPIIRDHFRPFRYGETRRFNVPYFVAYFLTPAGFAVYTSFKIPKISSAYQGTLLAVFAVVAAVLMGMLPVVQNIVGLFKNREKPYEGGEYFLFRQQVARLQVLRELYADIAFIVLVLTISLAPVLMSQVHAPEWLLQSMSGFVYFAGYSTVVSFLHIIAGIYFVIDLQADDAAKELMKKAPASVLAKVPAENSAL